MGVLENIRGGNEMNRLLVWFGFLLALRWIFTFFIVVAFIVVFFATIIYVLAWLALHPGIALIIFGTVAGIITWGVAIHRVRDNARKE